MEQKLVEEKWKNLDMNDLLFGHLWWFCHRICVQLTLYGPADRQKIVLRNLDDWSKVLLELKERPFLLLRLFNMWIFVTAVIGIPLISPATVLLLVLLYIASTITPLG